MASKWFTADFHLGMTDIIRFEDRPFKDISKMNAALLKSCCERAKEDDVIYHLGDLFSFKQDRGNDGMHMKPSEFLKPVKATFLNIRGNHDLNNQVFSVCESMKIHLSSRYPNVSMSHYPSYDVRSKSQYEDNSIHLCGHVHSKWKHCLDLTSNVLNVNVGVDAWKYQIVSADELIQYLNNLFKRNPNELFRCKTQPNGKVVFFSSQQLAM